jgi:hypothetical protein
MKSMIRTLALTVALALTTLATGHAVSDMGTCRIYCYDENGNLNYYGQTYTDFDGCCSNVADSCSGGHGRGYFSAQYFFFQGVC